VSPQKASLLYALDRFEASSEIRSALNAGKIVLANRYVASNMGHQGAKIKSADERMRFFLWVQAVTGTLRSEQRSFEVLQRSR
jgi:dTMP kinase